MGLVLVVGGDISPRHGSQTTIDPKGMIHDALIIFVKAPRPGIVKTRLAQSIGASAAAAAYRRLVEVLIQQLRELRDVELRFSPDDALAEVEPWLQPSWQARAQGAGELGDRLQRAFLDAFSNGAERVVVIGSDCPYVMPGDVASAWHALRREEVVLGPASDGGYWLIGLRASRPALFQDIPWSSPGVLSATLERARIAGLSVHLLRLLSDVDTADDWGRFLADDTIRAAH